MLTPARPRVRWDSLLLARSSRGAFAEHGWLGCARLQLSESKAQTRFLASPVEAENGFIFGSDFQVLQVETVSHLSF